MSNFPELRGCLRAARVGGIQLALSTIAAIFAMGLCVSCSPVAAYNHVFAVSPSDEAPAIYSRVSIEGSEYVVDLGQLTFRHALLC